MCMGLTRVQPLMDHGSSSKSSMHREHNPHSKRDIPINRLKSLHVARDAGNYMAALLTL